MAQKVIYSEPTGGLCNRMGALNYAYLFAKEYDCRLVVLWKNNFEAACRFEDVFTGFDDSVKIYNLPYFKKTPKELLKSGRIISFALRGIWHTVLDLYFKYRLKNEIELVYEDETRTRTEADALNHEIMERFALSDKKWCLISSYQCADLTHDYSALKFDVRFEEAVRRLYEQKFGEFATDEAYKTYIRQNVTGVHVRRGDHKYAIANNPIEKFIEKMDTQLAKNPDAYFYLASDGQDVIDIMQEKFPGRVIINEGAELSRKSKSGMENAIIDLLALSKTGRIIGSFGSTFSDMASYIGGIGLEYSNSQGKD